VAFVVVLLFILIVKVLLPREVLGALMLMSAAIILISADSLVNVARRELVQLLVVTENDDGYVDGAEYGKLMRLLEQTALALEESYGAIAVVLDGLDLNLPATHGE